MRFLVLKLNNPLELPLLFRLLSQKLANIRAILLLFSFEFLQESLVVRISFEAFNHLLELLLVLVELVFCQKFASGFVESAVDLFADVEVQFCLPLSSFFCREICFLKCYSTHVACSFDYLRELCLVVFAAVGVETFA